MSEAGQPVDLYIYDLTLGFASLLAPAIIGRAVEGVWHTAVVAYGREFFYGGHGITSCSPGTTQLGQPQRVERLGETFVPYQVFVDYIHGLSTTTYTPGAYNLLEHNCNHFSDEAAGFLCGAHVPKHILRQPEELLSAPQRTALTALLTQLAPTHGQTVYSAAGARLSRQDSPDYDALNNQIEEARRDSPAHRVSSSGGPVSPRPAGPGSPPGGPPRVAGAGPPVRLVAAARAVAAALHMLRSLRRRAPPLPHSIQSRSLEAQRSTLADKLARKERRREKKRKKLQRERGGTDNELDNEMAEAVECPASPAAAGLGALAGPSSAALAEEADERRREEQLKRARDPPILYKDIDGLAEFEHLSKALEGVQLTAEEQQSVEELHQYLQGEGSWVLGDDFLAFIGRLLNDPGLKSTVRVRALRCLAGGALREDVSLVLHQDRRHHALLNYAQKIDRHPLEEQQALALFMCNLFENISSSEWLLYISEWEHEGQPLSNIRATTKVVVHALLSEDPELRETGTALIYNVATKEVKTVRFQVGKALRDLLPKQAKAKVFDEVCVELAMAVLQLLQLAPSEEHLHRALAALARLAAHSHDVPQLIAIVGPDPAAYRGTSPRVDEQIDAILKKIK